MWKFLSPIWKQSNIKNSEHQALLDGVDQQLQGLKTDARDEMNLIFIISTATGSWLDEWGNWFGVVRMSGESDMAYSQRIISSTTSPKLTVQSIIDAANKVAMYTGADTKIYEPWNNIAKHNRSKFSGKDRVEDGSYWANAVIDLQLPYPVTDNIRGVVNSVKAAGVKVFYSSMSSMNMSVDTNPTDFEVALENVDLCLELWTPPKNGSRGRFDTKSKRSGERVLFVSSEILTELSIYYRQIIVSDNPKLSDFMSVSTVNGVTTYADSSITLQSLIDTGNPNQGDMEVVVGPI